MSFLKELLKKMSGTKNLKVSEQLLFDKVIGFRGIVPGCGVSTIVQNTAIALSERTKFNICVLDTSFLYPIQYPLLTVASAENKERQEDILDFSQDLSRITIPTQYQNVYLVHLSNRTIVDMLSGKDTEYIISKVMSSLKNYFDIILVDLSYEPTNIAVQGAIKCNKIFQVADSSLKCLYNVKKSINSMVTLAVPLAKAHKVILNKQLPDMLLGVQGAMEEAGLHIIGEIPLSYEIAAYGASGKRLYGAITKNKEVTMFNQVINTLVEEIAEKTPSTSKYFDVNQALKRIEAEREKEMNNDYESDIVETGVTYNIVELDDIPDFYESEQ